MKTFDYMASATSGSLLVEEAVLLAAIAEQAELGMALKTDSTHNRVVRRRIEKMERLRFIERVGCDGVEVWELTYRGMQIAQGLHDLVCPECDVKLASA